MNVKHLHQTIFTLILDPNLIIIISEKITKIILDQLISLRKNIRKLDGVNKLLCRTKT